LGKSNMEQKSEFISSKTLILFGLIFAIAGAVLVWGLKPNENLQIVGIFMMVLGAILFFSGLGNIPQEQNKTADKYEFITNGIEIKQDRSGFYVVLGYFGFMSVFILYGALKAFDQLDIRLLIVGLVILIIIIFLGFSAFSRKFILYSDRVEIKGLLPLMYNLRTIYIKNITEIYPTKFSYWQMISTRGRTIPATAVLGSLAKLSDSKSGNVVLRTTDYNSIAPVIIGPVWYPENLIKKIKELK